jgi:hypothetical protein
MRPDQFRRGDDLSHRFVCAFGLLLSIEREADKWPTLNADDVEAVTRCASDICGRINLAEIVAVHIGLLDDDRADQGGGAKKAPGLEAAGA